MNFTLGYGLFAILFASEGALGQTINPDSILNQFQKMGSTLSNPACPEDSDFPWIRRTDRLCVGTSDSVILQFLNELNDVRSFSSKVALPSSMKVNPCGHKSVYEPATNEIQIQTIFKNSKNEIMDTKYAYAVMAHEYGHGVFEAAMKNNKLWSEYTKKYYAALLRPTEIENQIRKYEKDLPRKNGSIDWDKVQQTHPQLKNAYGRVILYRRIYTVMQAYSELFGDVMAVIYLKDPQVIAKAVEAPRENDRLKRMDKMRDFSKPLSAAEKNQWNADLKKADFSADEAAPYDLLGPARHALWNKIEPKLSSDPEKQSELIKETFDLISAHFEKHFPDESSFDSIDGKKLNESFESINSSNEIR